jgi:protein-S-isoprenylcysteine O-methyltransferase Ste14
VEGRRVLLMTTIAFLLLAVYFLVAFVLRSWVQYRRTGDTGFRGVSGRPGSVEWWAGVLFVLALVATIAGPVAAVMGLPSIGPLDHTPWHLTGVVVSVVGVASTLAAQLSMGESWRIGVDAGERTALVTDGAFGIVRNPIFTAMIIAGAGLALVVPNVVSVAAFVVLVATIELQVRAVEEPYLARVHGPEWNDYASRVGRFIPWTGTRPRQRHPEPR